MFCLSHCLVFLPSVWGDPSQELRAQQTSSNFYCPTRFSADYPVLLTRGKGANEVCWSPCLWWMAPAWLALGFPGPRDWNEPGMVCIGVSLITGPDLGRHLSPPLPITNEWLTLYLIHSNTPCKECKWIWGLSDLPFIEQVFLLANKAWLIFSILQWGLLWSDWMITEAPVSRPTSNQGSLPHTFHTISMSNTGQEINECFTLVRQTKSSSSFCFCHFMIPISDYCVSHNS